jgi:hypothetical protein
LAGSNPPLAARAGNRATKAAARTTKGNVIPTADGHPRPATSVVEL